MNIKRVRSNTSLRGLRLTDDHRDLAIWDYVAAPHNYLAPAGVHRELYSTPGRFVLGN